MAKLLASNFYFFNKEDDVITVKNQIRFKVDLFGVEVFNFEGYGIEKYKDNKLISYESKTKQNDKEKFVNLIYEPEKDKFDIKLILKKLFAGTNNMIGNWWNHQILQADSQISPVSGSIKEQVVTFLAKEKIELYGKIIEVDHFKLTSKDKNIPKDKKLDFDIWYDSKNAMIVKVSYSRMGNWEYRLKNYRVKILFLIFKDKSFALNQPDSSLEPTNQSAQTPSLVVLFQ